MKKSLMFALFGLAGLVLSSATAFAGWPFGCHGKCTTCIPCKQYNAFSAYCPDPTALVHPKSFFHCKNCSPCLQGNGKNCGQSCGDACGQQCGTACTWADQSCGTALPASIQGSPVAAQPMPAAAGQNAALAAPAQKSAAGIAASNLPAGGVSSMLRR